MRFLFIAFLLFSCSHKDGPKEVSDELRKKIVVIDSGITKIQATKKYMCNNGVKSSASGYDKGYITSNTASNGDWHGSNVVGLIGERIDSDKYCIVSIKMDFGDLLPTSYLIALRMVAVEKNVVWLNLSLSGNGVISFEKYFIKRILSKGIGISVAAGNSGADMDVKCDAYPACLAASLKNPKFRVIGNSDSSRSNRGSIITDWEGGNRAGFPVMSGTSQSTAIYTGKRFSK